MIDVAASLQVFQSAATNLQSAAQTAKALIGLRDESKMRAKIMALNSAIVDAQSQLLTAEAAALAQVGRIRELEERIARIENWEREKQRYELTRLNPGVLVYSLKPSMANGEPPHDLCTKCYEDGMKSILQPEHSTAGIKLRCARCEVEITHW